MFHSQVADPAEQLSELEKFEDHQQAKEVGSVGWGLAVLHDPTRSIVIYRHICAAAPNKNMSTFNRYFSFPEEDEP